MAEEFLNINPPGGFPDKPTPPDNEPLPEERPVASGLKNIFVFFVLVLIVAASFFVSFQLGSRILSPVRKNPEPKIKAAIPETPASIAALQKLQAIMSKEAIKAKTKVKPVVAKLTPRLTTRLKAAAQTKAPRAAAKTIEPKRLTGKHYYKVQVGCSEDKAAANALGEKVRASGFDLYVKKISSGWRVQVGAYRTREIAEELRGKLKAKGFSSQIIYE